MQFLAAWLGVVRIAFLMYFVLPNTADRVPLEIVPIQRRRCSNST
jgi:hypothetical protein